MTDADERAAELLRRPVEPWNGARVERELRALHGRIRRRRRVRTAAVSVCILLAGAGLWRASRPAAPAEPIARPTVEPPPSMRLADGSTITPYQAVFIVQEYSERRARVAVDSGRIDLDVTPRPEREFLIEAGAFRISVLGTRFEVTRDLRAVTVGVVRGHVRVSRADGAAAPVDLRAGETRRFELTDAQAKAPGALPALPVEPEGPVYQPSSSRKHAPKKALRRGQKDWRPIAARGSYHEAFKLIEQQGRDSVADEVDDLLLASDSARLSGHLEQALPYLARVVTRHRADERASMAAFTQGRVLSSLGRVSEAAGAFDAALELGALGALHENALARAAEAHGLTGDREKAQRLARTYLERYPQGRWLSLVRPFAEGR